MILPEAHLAGKNRQEEKKELWFGLGAHSLIFIVFLVLCTFFAGSYYKNIAYLKDIETKNSAVSADFTRLSASGVIEFVQYLPALNELCCIAAGSDFSTNNPPLAMTFGL